MFIVVILSNLSNLSGPLVHFSLIKRAYTILSKSEISKSYFLVQSEGNNCFLLEYFAAFTSVQRYLDKCFVHFALRKRIIVKTIFNNGRNQRTIEPACADDTMMQQLGITPSGLAIKTNPEPST